MGIFGIYHSLCMGDCYEGRKMEEKNLDKMIDKHCKIITKVPGRTKSMVIFGFIIGIDFDADILIVSSENGVGCEIESMHMSCILHPLARRSFSAKAAVSCISFQ